MKNKFGTIYIKIKKVAEDSGLFTIKIMVEHAMESGLRHNASGKLIPRNSVVSCQCLFQGQEVFFAKLTPSVSRNPFFHFFFAPKESGFLTCIFLDEFGNLKKNTEYLLIDR